MNGTTPAGEPAYTTTITTSNTQSAADNDAAAYDVGYACIVLLFIIILCFIFYKCKRRSTDTRSLPITSLHTMVDSDSDDDRCTRLSAGLHDDILSTFPTFLYPDHAVIAKTIAHHKSMQTSHDAVLDYGSGCSICLADYRPAEVIRLLPECGHLFHLTCIDSWLKVQTTCPVCRKSLLTSTELT